MAPHNLRLLLDALAAAGVYVGRYDIQIAEWLAGWEPQTVAVVAGWITRASQPDRMRDGPRYAPARRAPPEAPNLAQADASTGSVDRDGDTGLAPREAAP